MHRKQTWRMLVIMAALLLVASVTSAIPTTGTLDQAAATSADSVSAAVAGRSLIETGDIDTEISSTVELNQLLAREGRSLQSSSATVGLAGSLASAVGCGQIAWLDCVDAVQDEVAQSAPLSIPPRTGSQVSRALGPGMNFGDALDAPREGDWSTGIEASHFRLVAEAGFGHVRLPVSWAGYASATAPYTIRDGIDPTIDHPDYNNIWERVDWAIEQAEANDLMIIINMHHFDALHAAPVQNRDRVIALWEQIAERYADAGDHVVFELLNEPHGAFTDSPELWNDLLVDLLDVVRESNPTRAVVIGPVGYNSVEYLYDLDLPDDDFLISSVHIYEPFDFTHQGAVWINPIRPIGEEWDAEVIGFAEGVVDRSWETQVSLVNREIHIEFDRQWAGFAIDFLDGNDLQTLRFQAKGEVSLRAGCRDGNFEPLEADDIVTTSEFRQYVVNISECPITSAGFGLLNASPVERELVLSNVQVCSQAFGCEGIVVSAEEQLQRSVDRAVLWSVRSGIPFHLGEFGTFSADDRVPLDQRAAWTETIVEAANEHDIPFAYWEFHSHFGAYDFSRNAWRAPLLDALIQ